MSLGLFAALFLLSLLPLLQERAPGPQGGETDHADGAKGGFPASSDSFGDNFNDRSETPPPILVEQAPEPETLDVVAGVIKRGDTISAILERFFSPGEIYELSRKCANVFPLSRICAGNAYAIKSSGDEFRGFEYEINDREKLTIHKKGEDLDIALTPIEYDVRVERIEGTIDSSLYNAVAAIGEAPELAVRLADIFAWDVDFIRDIRQGDAFRVLVEKRSREGESAGYGRILAARFVNQGRESLGFLFADDEGRESFYDSDGRSLRKAFLKAPLDFRRISSGFSNNRLHPVLGIRRAHPGIDYAARRGTPVKTVGDGKVVARGYDRASGNYIKIRHNSVYETSYCHLNGFARGIRVGAALTQGDVIGYVGSTGLSTGPHLDFRMKKHGRYINPQRVKTPSAASIPEHRMAEFRRSMEKLVAALGVMSGEAAVAEASEVRSEGSEAIEVQ